MSTKEDLLDLSEMLNSPLAFLKIRYFLEGLESSKDYRAPKFLENFHQLTEAFRKVTQDVPNY